MEKNTNQGNLDLIQIIILLVVVLIGVSTFVFGTFPSSSVTSSNNVVQTSSCEPVLVYGDRGTSVSHLQILLNQHPSDTGGTLNVDGVFGFLTQGALKNYQDSQKLPDTGVADQATWSHLLGNSVCAN
jgi:peptidoglycan hydrolase-like protein with peptidoglycan-binding domain